MPNVYYPVTLYEDQIEKLCNDCDELTMQLARVNIKSLKVETDDEAKSIQLEHKMITDKIINLKVSVYEHIRREGRVWENESVSE